jgi:hypothetical protein
MLELDDHLSISNDDVASPAISLPSGERSGIAWLNLALRQASEPLDWTIKDGRVIVSTRDRVLNAQQFAVAEIHPIPVDVISEPSTDLFRCLVALQTFDPDSRWSHDDFVTIIDLPGALAASKSFRVQRRYGDFLEAITRMLRNPERTQPLRIDPPMGERPEWHAVLSETITFRCDAEPLEKIVDKLAAEHRLPLGWDQSRLAHLPSDPRQQMVSMESTNQSLRQIIEELLSKFDLAIWEVDETLLITTKEYLRDVSEVYLYPVQDLTDFDGFSTSLVELIRNVFADREWVTDDFETEFITTFGTVLIVRQPAEIQREVQALIRGLRQVKSGVAQSLAATSEAFTADPNRTYVLTYNIEPLLCPRCLGQAHLHSDPFAAIDVIVSAMYGKDDSHTIGGFGPALVVRHHEKAHRLVEQLLDVLFAALDSPPEFRVFDNIVTNADNDASRATSDSELRIYQLASTSSSVDSARAAEGRLCEDLQVYVDVTTGGVHDPRRVLARTIDNVSTARFSTGAVKGGQDWRSVWTEQEGASRLSWCVVNDRKWVLTYLPPTAHMTMMELFLAMAAVTNGESMAEVDGDWHMSAPHELASQARPILASRSVVAIRSDLAAMLQLAIPGMYSDDPSLSHWIGGFIARSVAQQPRTEAAPVRLLLWSDGVCVSAETQETASRYAARLENALGPLEYVLHEVVRSHGSNGTEYTASLQVDRLIELLSADDNARSHAAAMVLALRVQLGERLHLKQMRELSTIVPVLDSEICDAYLAIAEAHSDLATEFMAGFERMIPSANRQQLRRIVDLATPLGPSAVPLLVQIPAVTEAELLRLTHGIAMAALGNAEAVRVLIQYLCTAELALEREDVLECLKVADPHLTVSHDYLQQETPFDQATPTIRWMQLQELVKIAKESATKDATMDRKP